MTLPSQEYLQSRIDYDPQTGIAKWKPVDESYGPKWKQFNTCYAGNLLSTRQASIDGGRFPTARLLYKLHHGTEPDRSLRFLDHNKDNHAIANMISLPQLKMLKDDSFISNATPITDEANQLFRYDQHTGKLYWKPRDDASFNTKYAGKEAGSAYDGYIRIRILESRSRAHRVAWFLYYGVDPGRYVIDHIDRNRSNNAIKNLRLATTSLNTSAASLKFAKGYTQYSDRYYASIYVGGVNKHLGVYDTEIEARLAYETAVELYKPTYQFTESEQQMLDELYETYPDADPNLQRSCHNIHVKAVTHYIDAAIVQGPN